MDPNGQTLIWSVMNPRHNIRGSVTFSVVCVIVDIGMPLKLGVGWITSIKQPVFEGLFALGNAGGSLTVICECWPTSYLNLAARPLSCDT